MSSTLFTISQSWHSNIWLYEQLAFARSGDAILLMQDAVLALQSDTSLASFVAKCNSNDIEVFALKEDVTMRGVSNRSPFIGLVDYSEFVDLVVRFDKQVAW